MKKKLLYTLAISKQLLKELEARQIRILVFFALSLILCFAFLLKGPLPQEQKYHLFFDNRQFLGIPNFLNVISNLFLLFPGISGLKYLKNLSCQRDKFSHLQEKKAYQFAFLGFIFSAFASAYYHLKPDDARLFFDRLAMTLVFTSLLSAIIMERIKVKNPQKLLFILNSAGFLSIIYWRFSFHKIPHGDLRFYALCQYYSLFIALPFLFYFFPKTYTHNKYLWQALALYLLAKFFEIADPYFGLMANFISGHTFKHLLAGLAGWKIVDYLKKRRKLAKYPHTRHYRSFML